MSRALSEAVLQHNVDQYHREEDYEQKQPFHLQTDSYCISANSSPPTGKQHLLPAMLYDGKHSRQAGYQLKTHIMQEALFQWKCKSLLCRVKLNQARPAHMEKANESQSERSSEGPTAERPAVVTQKTGSASASTVSMHDHPGRLNN